MIRKASSGEFVTPTSVRRKPSAIPRTTAPTSRATRSSQVQFRSRTRGQITRHVTVPLSRYGLIGSWLLMFLIFEREYSTGVYLLSPGTETIGSMLVSLWAAGAIDIVAALSFINILLVVIGLGIALRFGVKLHD